jgi:hypothetical protein
VAVEERSGIIDDHAGGDLRPVGSQAGTAEDNHPEHKRAGNTYTRSHGSTSLGQESRSDSLSISPRLLS